MPSPEEFIPEEARNDKATDETATIPASPEEQARREEQEYRQHAEDHWRSLRYTIGESSYLALRVRHRGGEDETTLDEMMKKRMETLQKQLEFTGKTNAFNLKEFNQRSTGKDNPYSEEGQQYDREIGQHVRGWQESLERYQGILGGKDPEARRKEKQAVQTERGIETFLPDLEKILQDPHRREDEKEDARTMVRGFAAAAMRKRDFETAIDAYQAIGTLKEAEPDLLKRMKWAEEDGVPTEKARERLRTLLGSESE